MCVKHYDIQSAYLNADLSHEVYMKLPEPRANNNLVCKLQKNIYGLKQGANEWNKKLHDVLSNNGYNRSDNDMCLYSKRVGDKWIYVSIHVDDLIVAATDASMDTLFQKQMNKELVLKDLGNLQYYLGIQFERDQDGMFSLHQQRYVERKLHELNLTDCKPSSIPVDTGYQNHHEPQDVNMHSNEVYRRAIGSLLYLATNSRPDIAVGTSILARHVCDPKQSDWNEVKRIFRYLKHTKDKRLRLGTTGEDSAEQLIGYADADWGGDIHDRKSNTGFCFKFFGATISWTSRKQTMVTLSSTEAEYIALVEAAQEALWIMRMLKDLNQELTGPVVIY